MTVRENFRRVLNFEKPDGRLPAIEWAAWWDVTIDRWKREGLPAELDTFAIIRHFGLDPLLSIGSNGRSDDCPKPVSYGQGIIGNEADYAALKPYLFGDQLIAAMIEKARVAAVRQKSDDLIIYFWVEGFFWFPRVLFGIMDHLYAFYDHPELMHRINRDLSDFHIRLIEAVFQFLTPDIMVLAEDMSYNKGSMISREMFREFLLPYYRKVIPHMKKAGCKVFIDSDGDVTPMIPWLTEAGFDGALPLERQAGVDIPRIRREYPRFLMLGGYDKMVMSRQAADMRGEFERLLPVMKSGGYIPSVDHLTPPEVSLQNYMIYAELLKEYTIKAI
ncbi:MAG TPA: hypothetical protein DD640_10480 [Clostridiales bacterium]|nr:hypothetical protein [Clostridiales bacterium]